MSARYRIVTDNYLGFEVQVWRWWLPIWLEVNFVNTHCSVESAERWLEAYKNKNRNATRVVKVRS